MQVCQILLIHRLPFGVCLNVTELHAELRRQEQREDEHEHCHLRRCFCKNWSLLSWGLDGPSKIWNLAAQVKAVALMMDNQQDNEPSHVWITAL